MRAMVLITMQVNPDPCLMQCNDLVKNIDHPPVICRERNVEGNNMQRVVIQKIKN